MRPNQLKWKDKRTKSPSSHKELNKKIEEQEERIRLLESRMNLLEEQCDAQKLKNKKNLIKKPQKMKSNHLESRNNQSDYNHR